MSVFSVAIALIQATGLMRSQFLFPFYLSFTLTSSLVSEACNL
ncbi:hypothetical protein PQG02_09505 [Nostoc sp. UHCC 0926]|nr:hypothetical protein [Nostoc sp. UHCC 0926]WDD34533.1 hypothetical protein PQG02_09505 [Nostoc sp. UHCC 0926]